MLLLSYSVKSQEIYQYDNKDVKLIFFDKNISQYVPHIIKEYTFGKGRHDQLWNMPPFDSVGLYRPKKTYMFLTDWNDDGNAGVNVIPINLIMVGMAPLNRSFDVSSSVERYRHLFNHEYTHIVMTDKYTKMDRGWRNFFGAKIPTTSQYPITALWSYLSTPRWYAPRWFHEGIACFMETWFDGGVGRSLGTYDEMYFRTMIDSGEGLYSAVGLETEGTSADFQLGATSYLYGTRFTNYLSFRYGVDSLFKYYDRTPGSKMFFSSQFKKIYGKSVKKVWREWMAFEEHHQKENLSSISQYPLTELTTLVNKPMGSASGMLYDKDKERLYLAANYHGKFAHISYIDLKTNKEKILSKIDAPMLYQTSYIALDKNNNRLFYTIYNSQFRGIQIIDADSGKKLKKIKFQRISELVYDNVYNSLYGIMSSAGVNRIVRYNEDLSKMEILYSFKFGQSLSDLAISNDGEELMVVLNKPNGNQELISIKISDLEELKFDFKSIKEIENVNMLQFSYSMDDSLLIGTSNYTGVQNIWVIERNTGEMSLLSNVKTGIFAPKQISEDTLVALYYEKGGMIPVKLKIERINDANSIKLLGQKVFERNPSLENIHLLKQEPKVEFEDVYSDINRYNSFKELSFTGAFPDISGYRDIEAFNKVTPVLAYRFMFQDPLGINSIKFSVGISPWSNNPWEERFHIDFNWSLWNWKLNASYNHNSFYDLFGPLRRSRAGYNVGVSYQKQYTLSPPFKWHWGASVNTYGMMDALPLFQEIKSPVTEMQTASAEIGLSKTRTSLGGVIPEAGYELNLSAYSYFAMADGSYKAFPSLLFRGDKGFLLPVGRNNSFWIRSAVGQSFGDENSPFGNDYFGGFRNNYVDNGEVLRYREVNAMPGSKIDQIQAHSFAKFTGEIAFTPIRFKNFGFPGFYPTHALFTLFSSDLLANPWGAGKFQNYVNVGGQLNIEIVLFSYLKTTWSVGYAHIFAPGGMHRGEWMFSLKLL